MRTALLCAIALAGAAPVRAQVEVTEATIADIQAAMTDGRATSVQITRAYLDRIEAYDQKGPAIDAILWLNPDALAEAAALDAERAERGPRGPLHGVPVVVKDNFDVRGLPTSAGSLALAGMVARDDAFQVRKLREAGAVILGKTNMHELAAGITTRASLGGQTLNPYDRTRNPGGSSGGTAAAVAASFAAVGWGTDACGSIRVPAAQNNVFGLRPTKGLSSIAGILPLSHTHDVAGPLARTVEDLAIALDATIGADPADPATAILAGSDPPSFEDALSTSSAVGVRLGILRGFFGSVPEEEEATSVVLRAIGRLVESGTDTVSVAVPDLEQMVEAAVVIGDEFKWDFAAFLRSHPDAPVSSLTELLERGLVDEDLVESLEQLDAPRRLETPAYRGALNTRRLLRDAVVRAMDRAGVDALVYPTLRTPPAPLPEPQRGSNCRLSSTTGLPALAVPAGFTANGLPIGMELLGRPLDDAHLVGIAHAYERVTAPRRSPPHTPALIDGHPPAPTSFAVDLSCTTCDPPGSDALVRLDLAYDPVVGTLSFEIETITVDPSEVFAIVITGPNGAASLGVVRQLSGPGLARRSGTITVDARLRSRLEAGDLSVEIFTRERPFGAGRVRVVLPR